MSEEFFLGAPPVVSNRNHFRSLDLLVEDYIFRFDTRGWPQPQVDALRKALAAFARTVVHESAWAFRGAAERGIDQVVSILGDPEFFRSTKKRRDAERKTYLSQRQKDRADRNQAEFEPSTPLQINAKIRTMEGMIKYHQEQAARYRKELEEFKNDPTKHMKLQSVPAKVIA